MEKVITEVPETYDDFNPGNEFAVLFNLRFTGSEKHDLFGMLCMVWRAPLLPQGGDILHVGRGSYDLVIQVDKKSRRNNYYVWDDDGCVTIEAELLHLRTPRQYLDRLSGLIENFPEYRPLLRGSLHIIPAVKLQYEEGSRTT